MHAPLLVRELTAAERQQLAAGLSSRDGFTLRRSQILLASAEGRPPAEIALRVGCSAGTVRNAIRAFEAEGPACLGAKSTRPRSAQPLLDASRLGQLQAILHQSPRQFGKPQSTWSLGLLAEVACAEGLTPRVLSHEAVRRAVRRLKVGWKRAKKWITSPDPAYARKRKARDRLIRLAQSRPDWVLGFEDEVWWRRVALPAMHAWAGEESPWWLPAWSDLPVIPESWLGIKAWLCLNSLGDTADQAVVNLGRLWAGRWAGRSSTAGNG